MHLVLQVLSTAQALQKEAHRIFRPHGLTPAQFNVLHLLSDQPSGMRASDLARALIVDPSNVTGLLKRMKQVGLLATLGNSHDRRQHVVGLSARGRASWRAACRDYERNLARLDAALGAEGRRVAGRVLQQLDAAVARLPGSSTRPVHRPSGAALP
jgi:MarR family 2-MHQ and catechol resistance regulon transcriptional repressor